MKYGTLPKLLGIHQVSCNEMMFYQYLPIKLSGEIIPVIESRLLPFSNLIGACNCDYIAEFGLTSYVDSYLYLTVKHQYQTPAKSFNRLGYHSDGFMTDDINYIWCDINPTVFNYSDFTLTQDHNKSLDEMYDQAMPWNIHEFSDCELLRLDQFNIHKVKDINVQSGMRTFFKLSVSKDKYNLIGNSHNYLLDYNWGMKPRKEERNNPS